MAQKRYARNIPFLFEASILVCVCVSSCGGAIAHYEDYSTRPVLYSDGKTLAEVTFGEDDRMIHCRLHELEEDADAEGIIRSSGLRVKYPKFKTMLQLINNCTRLEKPRANVTIPANSVEVQTTEWSSWSLWNGIIPGTKWCGVGDIAGSFEELGSQVEVDSCCRAHDHCPVKLKAFRAGYGLVNLSLYTKSHCDCDMEFFSCLKTSHNKLADVVGNFYFNIMQVKCLREHRPLVCIQNRTEIDEQCTKWGADPNSKNMQTSSTPLKY